MLIKTKKTKAYCLVIFKRGLEFAQRHVRSGTPVIALDVVLVDLQGTGRICQGVAIALGAQVRQAPVTIVDGIGWIQLQCLGVILDCVLVVFFWKEEPKSDDRNQSIYIHLCSLKWHADSSNSLKMLLLLTQ